MFRFPYLPDTFARGASQSAFTNTNPPRAALSALTNTNPPRAGLGALTNTNPPRSALGALNNTNPPRPHRLVDDEQRERPWPLPTPAPAPWRGLDPEWVYEDMSTTMAQALRRSRAKIVRPSDVLLKVPEQVAAAQNGENVRGSALWRWAPQWRVTTVSGELIGRFLVYQGSLWLLDPGRDAAGAPIVRPLPVFVVDEAQVAAVPWDEQVDRVLRAAVEREERLPEILSQADDFWPFFESVCGLQLERAPRTTELFAAAYHWSLHLVMQLKHGLAVLRPVQRSSLVMPVIATPGHGSLPSGHATMSAFMSELLHLMLYRAPRRRPDRSAELDRLARRIAFNRVAAGVHFPVDSLVGYRLGTQLARLFAALAGRGPVPALMAAFDDAERDLPEFSNTEVGRRLPAVDSGHTIGPARALQELFEQSAAELDLLSV